jgi:hypothetical protein
MQHNLVQQKKIEQKNIALKSSNLRPAFIPYKTKYGNQKESCRAGLLASKRKTALEAKADRLHLRSK